MRGLDFKRGPLKPEPSLRSKLALYFLLTLVVSAVVCAIVVMVEGRRLEESFLLYWLIVTPLFIAVIFGPAFGQRLAGAVGYHWSYLAAQSLEIVCVLTAFAIFAVAASLTRPMGWIFPVGGGALFLILAAVDFIRVLMRR